MALTQKEIEKELVEMKAKRDQYRNMALLADGAVQALEQMAELSRRKRSKFDAAAEQAEYNDPEPEDDGGRAAETEAAG